MIKLDTLAGNRALKGQISAQYQARGLSHAYILTGPKGIGKHTLANLLSAAFVCSGGTDVPCGACLDCRKTAAGIHPDVITVSGEQGRDLTVGQVRQMRTDAYIRPNEAARKVYLIEDAQSMNASAQNAMLKLLEEGPAYAAFLLLADNAGALLPTVRSRCETLQLTPVEPQECVRWLRTRFPDADAGAVEAAAARCGGILGRAVDELSGAEQEDTELLSLAERLVGTLETGSELERMELAVSLEKWKRERMSALLDTVYTVLCRELAGAGQETERRKRLSGAAREVDRMRTACEFNASSGSLAGWLAASFSRL